MLSMLEMCCYYNVENLMEICSIYSVPSFLALFGTVSYIVLEEEEEEAVPGYPTEKLWDNQTYILQTNQVVVILKSLFSC